MSGHSHAFLGNIQAELLLYTVCWVGFEDDSEAHLGQKVVALMIKELGHLDHITPVLKTY